MKKLAIIGSGDLGQQIAYHALHDGHYEPVGFFDDWLTKGEIKHQLSILGGSFDIESEFKNGTFDCLMIGIGYKHLAKRKELFEQYKDLVPFGTIIHSSSYVDKSVKVGKGVFIYPGCTLDMNVEIGDNVLLNVGCVIAHDSRIGKGSFMSPAVKVAGFVKIGESVNLGIGTCVIDNLTIGDYVKTGGGAVVIEHLNEPGLYVGVPAKFKKSL